MKANDNNIIFFDTETSTKNKKILDIGAIFDNREFHNNSIEKFSIFVADIRQQIHEKKFVCGHNIIHHDLKFLDNKIFEDFYRIDTLYLSPLLFPNFPYHKLVKDDKLEKDSINNPLNDAKTASALFYDELDAFNKLNSSLKTIYRNLLYKYVEFDGFFDYINFKPRTGFFQSNINASDTEKLIKSEFSRKICSNADIKLLIKKNPVELAYALSLINAFDYHSITPAWLSKTYPEIDNVIKLLCHTKCRENCVFCRDKLDIKKRLKDFFGFDDFRRFNGENLQEKAVQAAVDGKSLLAVFPTGGGKSLTYQLPALIAGEERRGLSIIISPLQSLMKDQVDNLNEKRIVDAVSINGLLSPLERAEALERVRSGLATILYISPESLRSNTIEKLIFDRNIVRFIIDEAHCFSSWGQDFRVDYYYIAEFIKKYQDSKNIKTNIPISCFTATAKQKVISDICDYFSKNLNIKLELFTTTQERVNLHYKVLYKANDNEKYAALRLLISQKNCPTICYVSRTKRTSEIAEKLTADGLPAIPFNGQMDADKKIANQEKFINGDVNIIIATSAFGMGVDKKDVQLVVHYDISDSLENYVQESGRAARDENLQAECYVLFNENDLDKHFMLLNQTKLSMAEIGQVWKAIKSLTTYNRNTLFASALEIARQAGWQETNTDVETRVKTALAALEKSGYIKRKKNSPRVFATSILVQNMATAAEKIDNIVELNDIEKTNAKRIMSSLISSKYKSRSANIESESRIDYICDNLGIKREDCIKIVNILRLNGVLNDDKDMRGSVQRSIDGKNLSLQTLNQYLKLEEFLFSNFKDELFELSIKEINEKAEDGSVHSSVKKINTLIFFYSIKGYLHKTERADGDRCYIALKDTSKRLLEKLKTREDICRFIVNYLFDISKNESNANEKNEASVNFSLIELYKEYLKSSKLFQFKRDVSIQEIETGLLYLSKIKAIRIEEGFLVLYNALEIERLISDNRIRYKNEDYKVLDEYYKHKIQQIHIVGEYANMLLENYDAALEFVRDYFQMNFDLFIKKYFKAEREHELNRNITSAKYNQLFSNLSDIQKSIIDDKDSKYIVVLAGPGSGKTRILVHKLASLLLLEDIKYEQLLMLGFSRASVSEFKLRLHELIGNAANYVSIKTFHSYCFDLLGKNGDLDKSDDCIKETVEMISSQYSEIEENLITKTVLVIDEAQDMDEDCYKLVKALILKNDSLRVILVGDDDQNIYEFRGSNSAYIKSFMQDYDATVYEMLDNYRSSSNLVDFSNSFVKNIKNRYKRGVIKSVKNENGVCQIVKYSCNNFEEGLTNALIKNFNNRKTCVLTNTNFEASKILGLLLNNNIRARLIQSDNDFCIYNLQELRYFLKKVKELIADSPVIDRESWQKSRELVHLKYSNSSSLENVEKLLDNFEKVCGDVKYLRDFEEFAYQSNLEDTYEDDRECIWVSTIHKSKGREFDNVYMFLDNVNPRSDEEYKKIYVGLTRAKSNLYIHTNTNLFDRHILSSVADKNHYDEARSITLHLWHSDVNLGSFYGKKENIFKLVAGDELTINNADICCVINNRQVSVGRLSKKAINDLKNLTDRGFYIKRAEIHFILAWKERDNLNGEETPIVLPTLYLERYF